MTEKKKEKPPTLTQRVAALEKSRAQWERNVRDQLGHGIRSVLDEQRQRVRDEAIGGEIDRAIKELERALMETMGFPPAFYDPQPPAMTPTRTRWQNILTMIGDLAERAGLKRRDA